MCKIDSVQCGKSFGRGGVRNNYIVFITISFKISSDFLLFMKNEMEQQNQD